MVALERDQGRLHANAERFHGVLLTVEIDDEVNQVFEFWLRHELAQDWLLLGADRTPGRMDADKDRLAGLLCGRKGVRSKGPGFGGVGRRNQDCACGSSGNEQKAARNHV